MAGCLLYHANELDAYLILIALFKNPQTRDNYLPDFPGLQIHFNAIDDHLCTYLPALYNHLKSLQVQHE